MLKPILFAAIATSAVFSTAASAGPTEDATNAVTTMLDKFNAGDVEAFFAAHSDGAVIIDEFAPYQWSGSGSAQRWVADYMKDAAAKGLSGGRIDYAAPASALSDGKSAYIVLPTIYRVQQAGKPMSAAGSMTFVMSRTGDGWKIASWTYAAPPVRAER